MASHEWTMALAVLLSGGVGLVLGLVGGGGSILLVPVLAYVAGIRTKPAIAMGLAVVSVTAAFGAFRHLRAGSVDLRGSLSFAALAIAGTWGGAYLSQYLPDSVQMAIFGAAMTVAAVFMLLRKDDVEPRRSDWLKLLLAATGVGFLTGLVGVGGGFLVVPALVLVLGLPMKHAVGSSLVVVAVNSAVGFVGHLTHVELDWSLLALVLAAALGGVWLGSWLSRRMNAGQLRKGFSALLLATSAVVWYRQRDVLDLLPPALTRALAGGALIGLASGLLLALNGRVAGISGIAGSLFGAGANDRLWRVAFLAGLLGGGAALRAAAPEILQDPSAAGVGYGAALAGGLLVGFGTRLGNGCTSGHGVCGIARGSPRSLLATAVFVSVGAAVVFLVRHVLGMGGSL